MNYTFKNTVSIDWKKGFLFLVMLCSTLLFSQQAVTGRITDESGVSLSEVIIVNMSTDKKVYSNFQGMFSIEANPNDELRFVKENFKRVSRRVLTNGENAELLITLVQMPIDVGEVKVVKKNSRTAAEVDKGEQVRQAVGLPQPVGKMREKPAEVKKVLLPMLLGRLNVQGVYDLISGKARKQKRQYRYDDLQENIAWIQKNIERDYFVRTEIPANRIPEFIEFSLETKPQISTYIKAKNQSAIMLSMEEVLPMFMERLNKNHQ